MKIIPIEKQGLVIKPQPIFAFIKTFPLVLVVAGFTYLAFQFFACLIWLSLAVTVLACYRYFYIRHIDYILTSEILRISRGIFFKRIDQVELYRIKDYVLTQPPLLQVFSLMDLMLKTTDPENSIIWLRGIPLSNLVDILRDRVQEARLHSKIVEIN